MQYRHGAKEGVTNDLQGKGLRGLHDPLLSGGRVAESEKYMETEPTDWGWILTQAGNSGDRSREEDLVETTCFCSPAPFSLLVRGLIFL